MNILEYPGEYFEIYFRGKHPKKFDFMENMLELVGVLVFLAVLQGIILMIANMFDFQTLLLSTVIPFVGIIILASVVRVTMHFFGGKAKYTNLLAVFFKYFAGLCFITGILQIILSVAVELAPTNILVLSITGLLLMGTSIFIMVGAFPTFVERIAGTEKLKQPKADMLLGLAVAIIFVLLYIVGLIMQPDLIASALGSV